MDSDGELFHSFMLADSLNPVKERLAKFQLKSSEILSVAYPNSRMYGARPVQVMIVTRFYTHGIGILF